MPRSPLWEFFTRERRITPMTALSLLLFAGFMAGSFNLVAPPTNSRTLTAAAELPEFSGPQNCTKAKEAAFGKKYGPPISVAHGGDLDPNEPGIVHSCFAAILKDGKQPSSNPEDYDCVGRSGSVTFDTGSYGVQLYADKNEKMGECKVKVCLPDEGKKGVYMCGAPKQFYSGQTIAKPGSTGTGSSYLAGDNYEPINVSAPTPGETPTPNTTPTPNIQLPTPVAPVTSDDFAKQTPDDKDGEGTKSGVASVPTEVKGLQPGQTNLSPVVAATPDNLKWNPQPSTFTPPPASAFEKGNNASLPWWEKRNGMSPVIPEDEGSEGYDDDLPKWTHGFDDFRRARGAEELDIPRRSWWGDVNSLTTEGKLPTLYGGDEEFASAFPFERRYGIDADGNDIYAYALDDSYSQGFGYTTLPGTDPKWSDVEVSDGEFNELDADALPEGVPSMLYAKGGEQIPGLADLGNGWSAGTLPDGKTLVIGKEDDSDLLFTEIRDPATGARMSVGRDETVEEAVARMEAIQKPSVSTELGDDQVKELLAAKSAQVPSGGELLYNDDGTPYMKYVLPDGKEVYVAESKGIAIGGTEVYDPKTNLSVVVEGDDTVQSAVDKLNDPEYQKIAKEEPVFKAPTHSVTATPAPAPITVPPVPVAPPTTLTDEQQVVMATKGGAVPPGGTRVLDDEAGTQTHHALPGGRSLYTTVDSDGSVRTRIHDTNTGRYERVAPDETVADAMRRLDNRIPPSPFPVVTAPTGVAPAPVVATPPDPSTPPAPLAPTKPDPFAGLYKPPTVPPSGPPPLWTSSVTAVPPSLGTVPPPATAPWAALPADPTKATLPVGTVTPSPSGGTIPPTLGGVPVPPSSATPPPSGPPAGPPPPSAPPSSAPPRGGGGGFDGFMRGLSSFLGGFSRGMGGIGGGTCPTNPQAMQQYQQQYSYQLQQYNQQLQQYNYQMQMAQLGYAPPPSGYPPQPPQPCTPGSGGLGGFGGTGTGGSSSGSSSGGGGSGGGGSQCPQNTAQPDASACTNGTWRQMTTTGANGAVCPTWQCVPTGTQTPTAEISCQPKVAEHKSTITIAYTCGNSTSSTGSGFSTNGAVSGSATITLDAPANASTANYAVRCENKGVTASAQCSVQLAKLSVVATALPARVNEGGIAQIGWVSTGMESCALSSDDQPDFTNRNVSMKSTSGVATTSPIMKTSTFKVKCTSVAGTIKEATTTVTMYRPGTVSSTLDARANVKHGTSATVRWSFPDAPDVSAISLWLVDAQKNQTIGLIAGQRAKTGTYTWDIPATGSSCNLNSSIVCARDLVKGRRYIIQASLYTPPNAGLGQYADPSLPEPEYLDAAYSKPFEMGD